jgi:N-acetylglucosamine-6-sulfatase
METVTSLDREIGRLLDALEGMGLLDDTVVIYTSDNGFLFGEHKRVELRWPFEEVLRIPFVVRAPGLVEAPGRRAEQMVLNIDVAPTLLELAGVEAPVAMQGRSFATVLEDLNAPGRQQWLVENYKEFPYRVPAYQGIRTERYLYVEYEGSFPPTLHDVRQDPQQHRDLAPTARGREIIAELRPRLAALRRGEAT